jgi:hypothetical protein
VSDFTVTPVAATPPKATAVAPVKPDPVIVTDVPPATGPAAGDTPATTGTAVTVAGSADATVEPNNNPTTAIAATDVRLINTDASPVMQRTDQETATSRNEA